MREKELNLITIGWHKSEMDFGINCSVATLTAEEMNELRIMAMVAISRAEMMWEKEQIEKTRGQAIKRSER
jgi:hypothetical protein